MRNGKIIPNSTLHFPNYIMGNPPFVGRRYQTPRQKKEIAEFFSYKDVDYVACWYKKAAEFIRNTKIECAFVSTNSIIQGEQVAAVWENLDVDINFAYRTFVWKSESTDMAHVHCVIIGFAKFSREQKIIFDCDKKILAQNINFYLQDAPNIFVKNRSKPLQKNSPQMRNGNVPLDGDALKIEAKDYKNFIKREPGSKKFIKNLIGGRELLYNEKRYVLWLVNVSPAEIKKLHLVYKRVELCKKNRLEMKDKSTQKLATRPTTFRDTLNPKKFIAIPMVSSGNREYIPMDFFDENFIPTNQVQIISDAGLYEFGILQSSVHNIWVRNICGYLGSSFRYSKEIVYNNFIWCEPTETQRKKIEQAAQKILDCRKNYPDASLADLYDDLLMPSDLRKAHAENDRAVMEAYGFENFSEEKILRKLMEMYKNLTEKN